MCKCCWGHGLWLEELQLLSLWCWLYVSAPGLLLGHDWVGVRGREKNRETSWDIFTDTCRSTHWLTRVSWWYLSNELKLTNLLTFSPHTLNPFKCCVIQTGLNKRALQNLSSLNLHEWRFIEPHWYEIMSFQDYCSNKKNTITWYMFGLVCLFFFCWLLFSHRQVFDILKYRKSKMFADLNNKKPS